MRDSPGHRLDSGVVYFRSCHGQQRDERGPVCITWGTSRRDARVGLDSSVPVPHAGTGAELGLRFFQAGRRYRLADDSDRDHGGFSGSSVSEGFSADAGVRSWSETISRFEFEHEGRTGSIETSE